MSSLFSFLIGIVAGLCAFTTPAAAAWASLLGGLHLDSTWAAFLGSAWTPWVFSLLAVAEYVTDQLSSTPTRTVPMQFGGSHTLAAA